MKMNGAKQVHMEAGPNMTPLVDVVMVILIFLMLAGSFGASEHYLISSVPIRKGASGDPNAKVPDLQELKITVDPAGTRYVARVGESDFQDSVSLQAALKQRIQAYIQGGTAIDKVQVIVAPGRLAHYGDLLQVYQSALEAAQQLQTSKDAKTVNVAFEQEH